MDRDKQMLKDFLTRIFIAVELTDSIRVHLYNTVSICKALLSEGPPLPRKIAEEHQEECERLLRLLNPDIFDHPLRGVDLLDLFLQGEGKAEEVKE